jgi:hypothetical protein
MKVHIVREAFSLDGVDYPRGTELTDQAIIDRAKESHRGHILAQEHEVASQMVTDDVPIPEVPKVPSATGDSRLVRL